MSNYYWEQNMTIWFYVKTKDEPISVGQVVCSFNFIQGEHPEDQYSYIMEKGKGETEYWEMKSKYANRKELALVALVYRTGDTVVFSEVNDDFAPNFIDPLLEKYGFDNVKWIVVPKR
jgi:hypothetical protein